MQANALQTPRTNAFYSLNKQFLPQRGQVVYYHAVWAVILSWVKPASTVMN